MKESLKNASIVALGVMTGRVITQVIKRVPLQDIIKNAHISLMTGFITALILFIILNLIFKRGKL